MWLEVELSPAGAEVQVSAQGSRGERTSAHSLGLALGPSVLARFAEAVRTAASSGKPLSGPVLEQARALGSAVLASEVGELRARYAEASAREPLLLRLVVRGVELQGVPWESLCKPGEATGFWASSPDIMPVRAVTSAEARDSRLVRGPLRVLAISPSGGDGIAVLKGALDDRINTGEVEWLDPLEGRFATAKAVFERLRREPIPHVLHFIGHGAVDAGAPVLGFADPDDSDEPDFKLVELFAQQIKANLGGFLRLIILECCEGARPSAFASAAEILAKSGASAVVAHLWKVRADVARTFSAELYRALAGKDRSKGDIAFAMNEARRGILRDYKGSAEAFSPVVYLRGPDGVLFDFKGRRVAPPEASSGQKSAVSRAFSELDRLLEKPFSLVLGDRFRAQRTAVSGFRERIHSELTKASIGASRELPMSALTQRFALHRGSPKLGAEFQKAFPAASLPEPFLETWARRLGPGVHTTLLRHPWLELALADAKPNHTIYVVQPREGGTMMLRRAAGGGDWEEVEPAHVAGDVDPDEDIIVLRSFGGYTPESVFERPLLTEDDYRVGVRDLEQMLPRDLANAILSTLHYRSALMVGFSVHTAHHRWLLARLYPQGIPRDSLVVVEPDDDERTLWETGAGLPSKDDRVLVVEATVDHVSAAFDDARES